MRNIGLAIAVFAMSFTVSSIAFVQSNKSSSDKQTTQKVQNSKRTPANKQEVRCPVSGKVVTDLKNAPKYTYRGKTYYFYCPDCLAEFKKNPQKYIQQAANTRTVSNAPTKKEGESCCSAEAKASESSCCSGEGKAKASEGSCCSDKKEAQPQPTEQAATPADKLICPVSNEELDEATAVRLVYNGKVYYTCCNGCKNKFLKDPETYAKKAEEISKLQGKPEKAGTN
jgi:YHS domain-containing protein